MRGVSLPMFLGLLKYYRRSYQDLLQHMERIQKGDHGIVPDWLAREISVFLGGP